MHRVRLLGRKCCTHVSTWQNTFTVIAFLRLQVFLSSTSASNPIPLRHLSALRTVSDTLQVQCLSAHEYLLHALYSSALQPGCPLYTRATTYLVPGTWSTVFAASVWILALLCAVVRDATSQAFRQTFLFCFLDIVRVNTMHYVPRFFYYSTLHSFSEGIEEEQKNSVDTWVPNVCHSVLKHKNLF